MIVSRLCINRSAKMGSEKMGPLPYFLSDQVLDG